MAVLNISAGIIQDIVPEAQKQKLNSQVLVTMKAQWAEVLVDEGGYTAIREAPMVNAIPHAMLPPICSGRRPTRSMRKKKMNWASSPIMEFIPWYSSVFEVEMPIWAKMAGEKYWIAETPVLFY